MGPITAAGAACANLQLELANAISSGVEKTVPCPSHSVACTSTVSTWACARHLAHHVCVLRFTLVLIAQSGSRPLVPKTGNAKTEASACAGGVYARQGTRGMIATGRTRLTKIRGSSATVFWTFQEQWISFGCTCQLRADLSRALKNKQIFTK